MCRGEGLVPAAMRARRPDGGLKASTRAVFCSPRRLMQAAIGATRSPVILIGAGTLGRALTHSINTHSAQLARHGGGPASHHAGGGGGGMRVVGLFDKDAAARAPHGAEPRQSSAVVTTNPVGQLKPENLQVLP